jgi:Ser/Thr protein kinase RdoA (MazF antagonist)
MTGVDPLAVLITPQPAFPAAAARRLLQTHYGFSGELEELASERDQNFRVRTSDGHEYVLKFANSAEDATITDVQVSVLLHLEKTHVDLAVPRIVLTQSGDTQVHVVGVDDRPHTMRMLTWVGGVPASSLTPRPAVAAQMGRALAKLGVALADFDHPASDYPLLWDIRQAGRLEPLLSYVSDQKLRSICAQHLRRFTTSIQPRLAACRTQVIFNDLHDGNVLVSPADPDQLVGIIDFGDVVKSPLVIDIAVAAAYLCRRDESPLVDVLDFLAAYHEVRDILPVEFELLPELMSMRNVLTIVISSWRAARYPANSEYILRSVEHARMMLDTLAAQDAAGLSRDFREYCDPRGVRTSS